MADHNEESLSTRDPAAHSDSAAGTIDTPDADTREGERPAPETSSEPAAEAETAQAESADTPTSPNAGERQTSDAAEPLLANDVTATFQERWEDIQTRFVDAPRGAVEAADGLVAKLMQQLAESFAQEREGLEAQWGRGEDISTEDLRVVLQRYRSFFQRLLSTE
jgi:hypothetical protein